MLEIGFFKDLALELARIGESLWALNFSVLLASLGWGVSSRGWPRGLPPFLCVASALLLGTFFIVSLLSISGISIRANDAAAQVRVMAEALPQEAALQAATINSVFAPLGAPISVGGTKVASVVAIAMLPEILFAVAVGALLSNLGRRTVQI